MKKTLSILMTLLIVLSTFTMFTPQVKAQHDIVSLPAGCRRFDDPSDPTLDESRLLIDLDIAGQGQIVYVGPGETVSGTCTYQIYSGAGNPSEINQGFFIMSWTPSWPAPDGYYIPVWNGISGVYPGVTNTESFSFTAPSSLGTYYLYWCGEAHYSMRQAVDSYDQDLGVPGTPAHAKIVVTIDELLSLPAGATNSANGRDTETILLSIDVDSETPGDHQVVTASPGETITVTATFQVWSSGGPGIIKQAFFIYSWTPSWPPPSTHYEPLYNGQPGYHPGVTQTTSFSVTVPEEGGIFYLWFGLGAHYSMELAVNQYTTPLTLPAHAKIVVSGPVEEKPVAILSAFPTTVEINEDVTFDASASYDPDGTVEYYWFDYGDGLNSGWISSSTTTHSYTGSGIYYAKVKVKDNDGLESEWSESLKITADYIELTEQYFPYLIFDEDEEYFPTDFYYDDENIDNNPSSYDISWPKTAYVHTVHDDENDYLTIEYWFYYVRDAKAWDVELPPPFPECWLAHDHDWESIFIFFDKVGTDYVPWRITYFKHSYLSGINIEDYYTPNSWESWWIEKRDSTHPVIYVALSSHASYQRAVPIIEIGLPLYYFPEGDMGIPIPELVNGGSELSYNDFEVTYVPTPDQSWPEEKIGDCIDAPWNRARWNDPWYTMAPTVIKNSLSIIAESPVNLLVIDPEGQRIGWDPETETAINEISGAMYSGVGSEPQAVFIPDPVYGTYETLVIGTAAGTYTLTVELITSEGPVSQTYTGETTEDATDYYSASITETGEIEVISWEYVFEDVKRGTMLKISTDDKHFQFTAPDKDFSIKEACKMKVRKHLIFIWHKDEEIKLVTIAIDTRIDFCFACAKDMRTGDRYLLIDKPGTE